MPCQNCCWSAWNAKYCCHCPLSTPLALETRLLFLIIILFIKTFLLLVFCCTPQLMQLVLAGHSVQFVVVFTVVEFHCTLDAMHCIEILLRKCKKIKIISLYISQHCLGMKGAVPCGIYCTCFPSQFSCDFGTYFFFAFCYRRLISVTFEWELMSVGRAPCCMRYAVWANAISDSGFLVECQ